MPEFIPASEKQKSFFNDLLAKKVVPTEIEQGMKLLGFAGGALDKSTARRWITLLMNAPYTVKPTVHTVDTVTVQAPEHVHISAPTSVAVKPLNTWEQFKALPMGYYTVKANGDGATPYGAYGDTGTAIYLVTTKKGKYNSGYKIARRLFRQYDGKPKWITVSNASIINAVGGADAQPVDIAEVAKLGLALGFCCVCLRMLTDPFSVANGIGPVCAKKYGYQPAAQLSNY